MRNQKLAALAVAATLLFSACGGSKGDSNNQTQGSTTPGNVLPGGSVVDYQT
jgi:hypothetical protein